MNVNLLFFISALFVVDVKCDCDSYIECFTEFLQEFLGTNSTGDVKNEGDKFRHKHIELDEKNEDFDKIIEDLTVLIKDVNANVNEHSVKKDNDNKTKIHVKVFEFHDTRTVQNDFTTVSTGVTDDIESTTVGDLSELAKGFTTFPHILLNNANMLPSETTTQSLNVIPLQSDSDNEIFNKYDFEDDLDDNSTDYNGIDYLELYKDTLNEDVEYIPTEPPVYSREALQQKEQDIENLIEESLNLIHDEFLHSLLKNITNNDTIESSHGDKLQVSSVVFPWIATIFLKNEAKGDQFDYVCDGALVSQKIVLTAARCVLTNTSVIDPENFIVILGKTSLQVSGGEEKIMKVSAVKPHENFTFTDGIATNDLAMLVLEDPVTLNEGIATAFLQTEDQTAGENINEALTTAWNLLGDLTLVYFDKEESKACGSGNKVENTFCATYGNEVALCPSYGGLYVTISADSRLHLQGLRTGNPQDRGVCYDKNVNYTSLNIYHKWIQNAIEANK